jgi:hypothetical protein
MSSSGIPEVYRFIGGGFHKEPPLNMRNSFVLQLSLLSPCKYIPYNGGNQGELADADDERSTNLQEAEEAPPVVDVLGALVLEEECEVPVVQLPIHDHCLEHGSFAKNELDDPVDEAQLRPVRRNDDLHRGLVQHPIELFPLGLFPRSRNRTTTNIPPEELITMINPSTGYIRRF